MCYCFNRSHTNFIYHLALQTRVLVSYRACNHGCFGRLRSSFIAYDVSKILESHDLVNAFVKYISYLDHKIQELFSLVVIVYFRRLRVTLRYAGTWTIARSRKHDQGSFVLRRSCRFFYPRDFLSSRIKPSTCRVRGALSCSKRRYVSVS